MRITFLLYHIKPKTAFVTNKLDNLIMMKVNGQITMPQFLSRSNEFNAQLQRAQKEQAELLEKEQVQPQLDIPAIEATLCEAVEFKDGKVSEWFIATFVKRITVFPGDRYEWMLDLAPQAQTVACRAEGKIHYPKITMESNLFPGSVKVTDEAKTFLIDETGEVDGDTSEEDLSRGRLLSRALGNGNGVKTSFSIKAAS